MPEKLGRFRILEPLGADFIGSRYLAFDPQISRQVVLRTLDPGCEDAGGLVREHFLQEARTAARLSHPNIIKVFGIHTEAPQPFVVLENLEGPSLEELLADAGPLPVERTVRLIVPVADALEYVHAEGVIHRDVRPGAIVVLPGDQPALTGFVMAKMADVVSAVTRQGLAVGTPGYASPELVTGGIADLRGDIFSLGAVIYEMLTGRQAFVGRNMAETLYRIAHADPDPPSSLVPGLDHRHDRLLFRALAKSPDKRQQSMGELRTELEAWRVSGAVGAVSMDDTDEITPDSGLSDADDTGRLPEQAPEAAAAVVTGSGADVPELESEPEFEPEPHHEPEPVPEPEPEPELVESPAAPEYVAPFAAAESGKAVQPPVPTAARAKGHPPPGERRKLLPVIAAVAAVLLVSLLAAWQLDWFGSSPANDAADGGEELLARTGQLVEADPAGAGDTRSGITGAGELPEDTAGMAKSDSAPEEAVVEPGASVKPPVELSDGTATRETDETADRGSTAGPPEEAVPPPPPPTGVLEVASHPWARVTLDGVSKGETPLRIDGVAEGEHRVSLVSDAGLKWTGMVTVKGRRSTYCFHNFSEGG